MDGIFEVRSPTHLPIILKLWVSSVFEKNCYHELARSSCFGAYFESWGQSFGPTLSTSQILRDLEDLKKDMHMGPVLLDPESTYATLARPTHPSRTS